MSNETIKKTISIDEATVAVVEKWAAINDTDFSKEVRKAIGEKFVRTSGILRSDYLESVSLGCNLGRESTFWLKELCVSNAKILEKLEATAA